MTQTVEHDQVYQLKLNIRKKNQEQQSLAADSVYEQLSPSLQRCVDLVRESRSSLWLTVLPIEEHGFQVTSGMLCFYVMVWYSLNTTKACHCGTSFSVDHAMVCPYGGFPIIRHNEVHDLTATLLTLNYVIMLQLNHHCKLSLQRPFLMLPPIFLMMLIYICM